MSLGKFSTGHRYAEIIGVPFIFVVKFVDGIYFAKLEKSYNVIWGGRNNLRDSADVEPLMLIPLDGFKRLHNAEN